MKNQLKSCEVTLKVPFHDLDPMQVVWHGNYLKYFDISRFALFDHLKVNLYDYYLEQKYLFPVTRTNVKYIYPLRYNDEFICRCTLVDATIKIVCDFEIRTAGSDKVCARARGEQVAVTFPDMEMLLEIPESVRKALGF